MSLINLVKTKTFTKEQLKQMTDQLKREEFYKILKYKKQVKMPGDERTIRWNWLRRKHLMLRHWNLLSD